VARTRLNQTQFALLGLLDTAPGTGYDLKRRIEESISHFWREGWGQIYPTLKKLESEKLVARSAVNQGKRERHVYRVTRAGRARLATWLASPALPEVPRNELLLKLFFGSRTAPGRSLEHVESFRLEQERLLVAYTKLESQLRQEAAGHSELPFWLITLRYGRRRVEALIAWCIETQETLEAVGPGTKPISEV
jgi:PadR family transcriptional regulator, regulatory protein AphA